MNTPSSDPATLATGPIPVGLVGVTGYTGMELARLLAVHPCLELTRATSRSEAGKALVDLFPFLQGTRLEGLTVTPPDPEDLARSCRLVFLATPHGAAMDLACKLLDQPSPPRVVDLSADFRLRDAGVYKEWYGLDHVRPALLDASTSAPHAVYGLVELNAGRVATARLVANPGCYPTAAILGLTPALKAGVIEPDGIVIDAKSGTSGAGRKAAQATLFCEISDTFRAYSVGGKHRHTPEIEQELSIAAGKPLMVAFNPHILPINRGILATMYATLATSSAERVHTEDAIRDLYRDFYAGHPWVRVLPKGRLPETRWVRGTMFVDIAVVVDKRTGRLIVLSAIDNVCRGASGQAVANANLMLGLPPEAGLAASPFMP